MLRLDLVAGKSWVAPALVLALASIGCSDDDGDSTSTPDIEQDAGSGSDAGSGGEPEADAGGTETPPLYMMSVSIYSDEGSSKYALFRDELDLDIAVEDLAAEGAREFPAYTGVAAIDGHVIVGESQAPVAKKFSVGDGSEWTQVGDDLRFDDYVNDDVDGLNFYFQHIRGTDMYFFFGADRTSRLHWNTDEWVLKQAYEDTNLPTRAGWTMGSTGNRTGVRDFSGPIVQTFTMSNNETFGLSDESWIAVYDATTHLETSVIEVASCPGLQQTTIDEDGNLYLSTTFNAPVLALYGQQAPSCIVRLNADGTKDEEWGNKVLADLTGGNEGVNFRYLQDGMAVANVLHHERIEGADFSGEIDPQVVVAIQGEWTDDGFTPQDPTLWELELIDLEAGTSRPITGFDAAHDPGSYTIFHQVDGRVFVTFQIDPFGMPSNAIYELDLASATVSHIADVQGELEGVSRLR